MARALVNATGNEQAFGGAYHATDEEWMTWDGYHRGVAEAWGAPGPALVHIPTDLLARAAPERAGICAENLQFDNVFDNSAARADLGFEFTTRWVDGLKPTLAWLEENDRIDDCDTDPLDDRIIAAWQRLGQAMVAELSGDQ